MLGKGSSHLPPSLPPSLGRKVAIDASMCLYQFLIAVRSDSSQLTNADGETTR